MLSFHSLLLLLPLLHTAKATCAQDNCYNNLLHNSASSFCATYTTTINTGATGLPTYIITSCISSRLSSACSCLYPASTTSTSTPTTTTTPATVTVTVTQTRTILQPTCILHNGDFGLDPWVNEDIINESSYGYNAPEVSSPGYESESSVLVSFPGAGIYELDQYVTFPSTPISLTLTFYAMTTQPANYCSILAAFGRIGGGNYAQTQVSITGAWAGYSVSGTTDGYTLGYVALVVQCEGGTNNEVFIDDIILN